MNIHTHPNTYTHRHTNKHMQNAHKPTKAKQQQQEISKTANNCNRAEEVWASRKNENKEVRGNNITALDHKVHSKRSTS